MPTDPFEPYVPRSIRSLGVWQLGAMRMKSYSICWDAELAGDDLVAAARAVALERLESSAPGTQHYGVGFVGIHQGRTGNFVFVDWWADENELHHHVYASARDDPTRFDYVTPTGLTACVWDLHVLGFERQAWLETMLAAMAGPDVEAYLARRFEGAV